MNTLLLALNDWDLVTDSGRNIASAAAPYALAQDVASACRTFLGEVWYNTTLGIPYFEDILGHTPPLTFFQEQMVRAALTVPGVVSAQCTIQSFVDRTVTGQVTFTDSDGQTGTVSIP